MFNETHQYYSLCMFFLEDYMELEKPVIWSKEDQTLTAEWIEKDLKLEINLTNLNTSVFIKNQLDLQTNLYIYGRRYLLKKHIHLTLGTKQYG